MIVISAADINFWLVTRGRFFRRNLRQSCREFVSGLRKGGSPLKTRCWVQYAGIRGCLHRQAVSLNRTDLAMKVEFWAKTTVDSNPGISVMEHMANVGFVASCLAQAAPNLLVRFGIDPASAGALAALHDLGKISPGFQQKCAAWLEANRITEIAQRWTWDTAMESDHGAVTHAAVQEFLVSIGAKRRAAKFLSAVLGGHHGRLHPPSDRAFKPTRPVSERHSGIDWDKERIEAARAICGTFEAALHELELDDGSPGLWWLAGLTSISDWIGSDEAYFSPVTGNADAATMAAQAINTIGLVAPDITPGLSFHDLFGDVARPETPFTPNEMQLAAKSSIAGPGVYVIEAPMGLGKTEAALWAAYQLMVDGNAEGIYFALPTQATSNRMHLRMAEFVRRIAPAAAGSRLIHSNSWLLEQSLKVSPAATAQEINADDASAGRDWFASAKRALLAPFGVGTIDQALLGVVAAKHFFVRQYALAGKVVILDEVHSYDIYTGTLIDSLVSTLEGLGCTVIILSATLTGKRRNQIVSSCDEVEPEAELPYPLITGRTEGRGLTPFPAAPPATREIEIAFTPPSDASAEAVDLAQRGGCVLWICNTVDSAQVQYQRLLAVAQGQFPLGLLHSRFPFWRREELESEWMERLGKSGTTRCGSILVSTQIVEQSVDVDADLIVTELAPTDMLLQRMGRLWRHERNRPRGTSARLVILEEAASLDSFREMSAADIIKAFGRKAYVYAPYVLLRSLAVWKAQKRIELPTDIRSLIETTYEDLAAEPEAWQSLYDEWFATDSCKKMLAARNCNIWTVALDDDEGVQTRLNELPTLSFVLCRSLTRTNAEFLDETRADFHGDHFHLSRAQAIHRNIVRVQARYFASPKTHAAIGRYVRGPYSIGLATTAGAINAEGLGSGIRLSWSVDLGIVIENTSEEEK